jgi:hypothetical protein
MFCVTNLKLFFILEKILALLATCSEIFLVSHLFIALEALQSYSSKQIIREALLKINPF